MLFGTYGEDIRFAALSINGLGLRSYGAYGLVLRDVAVAKRASLLEENAYNFVKRHHLDPSSPIPEGYRSSWDNRHELAIAKLADVIGPDTAAAAYAGILLANGIDRAADDFIEVHIFGPFNINAVESVSGNSAPKRAGRPRSRRDLPRGPPCPR